MAHWLATRFTYLPVMDRCKLCKSTWHSSSTTCSYYYHTYWCNAEGIYNVAEPYQLHVTPAAIRLATDPQCMFVLSAMASFGLSFTQSGIVGGHLVRG
jgi:hypothetical protein